MISSIPNKWPAVFNSIGFGSLAILIALGIPVQALINNEVSNLLEGNEVLSSRLGAIDTSDTRAAEISVELEELTKSIEEVSELGAIDLMIEAVQSVDASVSLLLGTYALFVSYVVGEVGIAAMRNTLIFGKRSKEWAERVAVTTYLDNAVIIQRLDRAEGILTISAGFCLLAFSAFLGAFIVAVDTRNWVMLLGMTLAFVASIFYFRHAFSDVGEHFDEVIAEYEKHKAQTA